ncbi:MAG TPA: ABC transporter permease [Jatrophihabitantaceae bacterium]|jgi:peptide/nickel transport system permease protein|nr:ABC transporter permease [Jatrophihabitantaceae bacterium]
MVALIAKRIGAMLVILFLLVVVLFFLKQISPGDPVHLMLGGQASATAIAHERHVLGLDRPVTSQFAHYLDRLIFHADPGMSYVTRRSVRTDLATFMPATLELAAAGLIIALVLGTILAFATTLKVRGSSAFRVILIVGASTPAFLLGVAGVVLFYEHLGWLPSSGRTSYLNAPTGPTHLLTVDSLLHGRLNLFWDAIKHLVLPAVSIALGPAVAIGRVLRSSLIEDLGSDYARTARAKGLTELRILRKHILRNAIGAAMSMTGLQVGLMFAGVLVVEQVFSWPGIGLYVSQAIQHEDFPAIAGVTLVLGAVYVVINTIVDVLQAVADPRIKV